LEAGLQELQVELKVALAKDLFRFYRSETEEVVALRGVCLEVDRAEIVAVLGPSGSGKSTLLACLAGLEDPDGGAVWIAGDKISHRTERQKAGIRARSVGMVFQERNLIEHLTVAQNVMLAARLAGMPGRHSGVMETLGKLGMADRASWYPSELSGGEAARAGLAAAIVKRPPILMADEPTAEVGTAMEQDVLNLIKQLQHDGTSAILVTHSRQVAAIADRTVHLVDGRLVV
jgi:putative ABC transport system ATP-binding protein